MIGHLLWFVVTNKKNETDTKKDAGDARMCIQPDRNSFSHVDVQCDEARIFRLPVRRYTFVFIR